MIQRITILEFLNLNHSDRIKFLKKEREYICKKSMFKNTITMTDITQVTEKLSKFNQLTYYESLRTLDSQLKFDNCCVSPSTNNYHIYIYRIYVKEFQTSINIGIDVDFKFRKLKIKISDYESSYLGDYEKLKLSILNIESTSEFFFKLYFENVFKIKFLERFRFSSKKRAIFILSKKINSMTKLINKDKPFRSLKDKILNLNEKGVIENLYYRTLIIIAKKDQLKLIPPHHLTILSIIECINSILTTQSINQLQNISEKYLIDIIQVSILETLDGRRMFHKDADLYDAPHEVDLLLEHFSNTYRTIQYE